MMCKYSIYDEFESDIPAITVNFLKHLFDHDKCDNWDCLCSYTQQIQRNFKSNYCSETIANSVLSENWFYLQIEDDIALLQAYYSLNIYNFFFRYSTFTPLLEVITTIRDVRILVDLDQIESSFEAVRSRLLKVM
jgi:hypothetical protein